MTMAITGYYHGTEDGGESKFGKQKKFIVLNKLACVQTSPLPQEKSGEETSVNRRR